MRRSLCADRGSRQSGNAIFGHLPVFSARWSFDRFAGNDERRSLYEGFWARMNVSMKRYLWSVARRWVSWLLNQNGGKFVSFFFHLFERKIAKKAKIDAFGDCKAQLFFFNANNRGMDAK